MFAQRRLAFRTSLRALQCSISPALASRNYTGIIYSNQLEFEKPQTNQQRTAFRIIAEDGQLVAPALPEDVDEPLCLKLYQTMVLLQIIDQILYEVQRQGRISFYLTASGEEAVMIGSSSAILPQDHIFSQYREQGVFLYRGLSLEDIMDQCFCTVDDPTKGRQMPIHYASKKLNIHTVSSPLGTQIPQAAGAAFSLKMNPNNDAVAVAFFGDGAASEGDFHAAMNFGATLDCPALFICRNNGYAISTPISEQYRGDGVVSRASGYGMASIRVDGNDVLAVREVTKQARDWALKNNQPVLIEAMAYRLGHHSTSDDSTRYREVDEIQHWQKKFHPIDRMRKFMESQGMWDAEREKSLRKSQRKRVLESITVAENKEKLNAIDNLFSNVYDVLPPHLERQRKELGEHLEKYPDHYDSH